MRINKPYLKDALTFLWVSVLCFLLTMDVIYPYVAFALKLVLYIASSLIFILGISTFIIALFGRKKE